MAIKKQTGLFLGLSRPMVLSFKNSQKVESYKFVSATIISTNLINHDLSFD